MRRLPTWIAAALLALALPAAAADKAFRLRAAPELIDSGVLAYLVPRFSFKTDIAIEVEPLDAAAAPESADALLADTARLPDTEGLHRRDVFAGTDGTRFTMVVLPSAAQNHAERFLDWLTSPAGKATLGDFQVDGQPVYAAVDAAPKVRAAAVPAGDAVRGEELALLHCGRCHVVSGKNRYGGIGSTPSFAAMRSFPHWKDKFEAFWTRKPHPSFTQVHGVTEPFNPEKPPHLAPVELTMDDVEALLAFVRSIEPKDLGAPIQLR